MKSTQTWPAWLTVDVVLIAAIMAASVYSVGAMLWQAGDLLGGLRSLALAGAVVRFGYVLQGRTPFSRPWWFLAVGFAFALVASTFYAWLFFVLNVPDMWLAMSGIDRTWLATALALGTELTAFWLAFLAHVGMGRTRADTSGTGDTALTETQTERRTRTVRLSGPWTRARFLSTPEAARWTPADIVSRAGVSDRTARRWLAAATVGEGQHAGQ